MTEYSGQTEKELIRVRKEKLLKLKELGINPYPSNSNRTHSSEEIREQQKTLIKNCNNIVVAGRIVAIRGHGKLIFLDLMDRFGRIQLIVKFEYLKDFSLVKLLDLGDFIEAKGQVINSKSNELSVSVIDLRILSKSLRPIPDKVHGLKDEETRYRKRYLELLMNENLRDVFIKKATFWQSTRNFMIQNGFDEVETPVLENTSGGADASPFTTHHDALDIDLFLRISMGELWQKRLMIGGFEKTFEIGRQFRNEGMSKEHLQDYTQLEFYWAYANYNDSMKLVQKLYRHIVYKTFGTYEFTIGKYKVDFSKDWPLIDYVGTIKERLGINILESSDSELYNKAKELRLPINKNLGRGRLIDAIWKSIRKEIGGPVFLVNHPVEVSPLAKRHENNPKLVERYQVILAGSEMGNGYSELNDPLDQKERFAEQARLREKGDTEAQMHDEDFVEALEYGMPPTTGFGFSERLFSFLIDKPARECVIFPLLKKKNGK